MRDATTVWLAIGLLSLATLAIKGAGPFLLGRDIPERWRPAVALLPTALVAGIVVVAVVLPANGGGWETDPARLVGLAVATVALVLRLPLAVVLVAATIATAVFRLWT
jgi:branched-subunit amino acid transport protein